MKTLLVLVNHQCPANIYAQKEQIYYARTADIIRLLHQKRDLKVEESSVSHALH